MRIFALVLAAWRLSLLNAAPQQFPLGSTSSGVKVGKLFTPSDYEVVPGFFRQSSPDFDPDEFSLLSESFGLLPDHNDPDRWLEFVGEIETLNELADEHTTYKVLFLARHGEGWHNVAENKYGTPAWNAYWSRVYGDEEMTWGPDPSLTPFGRAQARNVSLAWAREIAEGAPIPESLYSSPLSRSAETLRITWKPILGLGEKPSPRPLVKEMMRETIGVHTCDQRSRKSALEERFPEFDFEAPFAEYDQLWSATFQESTQQQALRAQQLLNSIFATDSHTFLSLTAHGGAIQSLCRALGHPIVRINPGEFLPVVVKAVSYPEVTGRSFAGGQSVSAPPLPRRTPASR